MGVQCCCNDGHRAWCTKICCMVASGCDHPPCYVTRRGLLPCITKLLAKLLSHTGVILAAESSDCREFVDLLYYCLLNTCSFSLMSASCGHVTTLAVMAIHWMSAFCASFYLC